MNQVMVEGFVYGNIVPGPGNVFRAFRAFRAFRVPGPWGPWARGRSPPAREVHFELHPMHLMHFNRCSTIDASADGRRPGLWEHCSGTREHVPLAA